MSYDIPYKLAHVFTRLILFLYSGVKLLAFRAVSVGYILADDFPIALTLGTIVLSHRSLKLIISFYIGLKVVLSIISYRVSEPRGLS
jgi:hypothetical protein